MNPVSASLVRALEGDVIVVPVVLARRLGIVAAAFLRQAAYFSAINESRDGWFFLEQQGEGDVAAATIYKRLGSWESLLGIGPDAQQAVRSQLKKLGLLEESRKGMVHGRLQYRVDPDAFLSYLSSCGDHAPTDSLDANAQSGKPDCACREAGLNRPDSLGDINQVEEQVSKPAACSPSLGPVGGQYELSKKRLRHRASGITTWYDEDVGLAESIEKTFSAEDIDQAVRVVKSTLGRNGKPLSPVPGLVRQKLEALVIRRETESRHQQRLLVKPADIDRGIAARGADLLPPGLRKRLNQT